MFATYRVNRLSKRCNPQYTFLQNYLEGFAHKPVKSTPIHSLRLLVLDTETTGLDPAQDRILSIGTVAVQQERICIHDSLNLLVANKQNNSEAISIHGIIPQESASGSQETIALAHFLKQLRADVIVAHHAAFDVTMLERAIQRTLLPRFFLYNPVLDTVFLTKKLAHRDPDFKCFRRGRISLDDLCAHLDIAKHDRHTAWGDAYITAQILLILLKKLYQSGSRTLGDLLKQEG